MRASPDSFRGSLLCTSVVTLTTKYVLVRYVCGSFCLANCLTMSPFPLLLALLALLPAHEYHVSKTNVRYVAERQQVQVEMHLFVEDMELDMMASGAPDKLEIGTKKEHTDAKRYLETYLQQHFVINWNGQPLDLDIVGYELADDLHGLWIYLLAEELPAPEKVKVTNSLITATYADQKNIVKFFNGSERSATLLMSKDRPEARWNH